MSKPDVLKNVTYALRDGGKLLKIRVSCFEVTCTYYKSEF